MPFLLYFVTIKNKPDYPPSLKAEISETKPKRTFKTFLKELYQLFSNVKFVVYVFIFSLGKNKLIFKYFFLKLYRTVIHFHQF